MRFRAERYLGTCVEGRALLAAAATAALLACSPAAAQSTAGSGSGITFFTGPNFTGNSKTLTLAPDQPYAAIPFVGDELNQKIASLRADPEVGAILFQRPYFASRDDACGPVLGSVDNPDAWWLGLTADFEPPVAGSAAYETGEMQDDDYSSLIAYRRDLGPPPGFLLLERRSYYNRSCERTADQSYYNRLFIAVPNPPQREACTDLAAPASAYGAGADAPRFTRITEAFALTPGSFSPSYRGIDHRFILTVFDGPGCSGESITLPSSERGQPASYRLSDFNFDRRAKSVMIRYQSGPLERYFAESAAPAQATLAPTPAPAPTPVPAPDAAPPAAAPAAPPPPAVAETPPAAQSLQPAPPSAPTPQVAETPAPPPAPAAPALPSSGVTFFTGPNFSGSSKTLTLGADQPFAAIPFVGDELNQKIASLRADPEVGAILFQRPYFASRDDACGPNLGTTENPDAWWLGLTADFEPPFAGSEAYETGEMQDNDYSSLIAYRRDLGPPPGFLLLERRSYYNRSCERSADQSYFNRLFVPVPNPPQREACTDLAAPASAYGAGADAPEFVRISEAFALYPESFSPRYGGIDHRFVLTLFDGPGCSGQSITLPSREGGRPASYRLSDFEFDRRVKSVMIRYQRGPLDPYLAAPDAAAQVAATPPLATAPAAPSGGLQPQPVPPPSASPAPATGGLQPPPPSAPAQPQQALQPAPELRTGPIQPTPDVPSRPAGPQEETFRFPVHQVYRLNFCLADGQGCGEPAANKWCEERGFSRASRWVQEDNIGALYPTVFLGNGSICDKFLCDGFEEITCRK